MKKKMVKILSLTMVMVMLFGLTLCGTASAAKIQKIVLWHAWPGSEGEALKAAIAKFQRKHKDVKVELLMVPFDALQNKFSVVAPTGQGPDVIMGAVDWIGPFVKAGLLEPLDKYAAKDKGLLKKYIPATIDMLRYKGKLYGMPESIKCVALVYNTNMIKTPPKNTDELIAMAKANTGNGKYGFVYAVRDFYYSAPWFTGFGATILDKNGTPGLNSPGAIKAAKFISEFYNKHKIMPREADFNIATSLFMEGKAAMVMTGSWQIGDLEKANVPFKVTRLPMVKETGKWPAPFIEGTHIMLGKSCKNKQLAFELIKYLTSAEIQTELALKLKHVPSILDAYKNKQVANNPIIKAYRDQASIGTPMPNMPEMNVVFGPAGDALGFVWNARKTPEAAMRDAQNRIVDAIEELRS